MTGCASTNDNVRKSGRLAMLLVVGALALLPHGVVRAACDEEVWFQANPSHVQVRGECASSQEAFSSCEAHLVRHNYPTSASGGQYCTSGQVGHVWAGWLKEDLATNKYPPFYLINYYFGAPLARMEKNAGPPPCKDQCAGDPVNVGTGNKFEQKVEYRGGGPFPLEFGWTYNASGAPSVLADTELTLGFNRTTTFSRVVRVLNHGLTPLAYVARPDGKTVRFKSVAGQWVADADSAAKLMALQGGSLASRGRTLWPSAVACRWQP